MKLNPVLENRTSAAVLVLTRNHEHWAEVLLIERSSSVKTHQNQVAFPGGGFEPADQNNPIQAALRECFEEVGIQPDWVEVMKTFSPLPTLTSGYVVFPVYGLLKEAEFSESNLILDHQEVAHAEWVSVRELLLSRNIENGFPVFRWSGKDRKERKVWGLTAIIFDLVFNSDAGSL